MVRGGVVAVVLGLCTTVAVAWTLGARRVYGPGYRIEHGRRLRSPAAGEGEGEVFLALHAGRGWRLIETVARRTSRPLLDPSEVPPEVRIDSWAAHAALPWGRDQTPWPQADQGDRRVVRGTGWPLIALWHQYRWRPDPSGSPPTLNRGEFLSPGGIRLEPSTGTPGAWPVTYPRALPLRPAFPGFLENTAVFSAAWGFLIYGPGTLRRSLRGRRGACPTCAYDLRGIPQGQPCPECGAFLFRATGMPPTFVLVASAQAGQPARHRGIRRKLWAWLRGRLL